jgi:3-oxoacyl-[acyl-carrier protein] reductase
MELELAGDVALVTGAGQGIGKQVALDLARAGAAVAVNDLNPDLADGSVRTILKEGGRAVAVAGDISREEEVQDVVGRTREHFGPVDILINNAGISPKPGGTKTPVWAMDRDEWQRVVDVNLTGALLCCRAVTPGMVERRRGVIVFLSSQAAREYVDFVGCHYHATKAGLIGLAHALAGELAPHGVRVCAVAPGRIRTELATSVPPEVNERFLSRVPMGTWGEPGDVSNAILFLCSTAAGYVTGVTLDVNGGAWMS